MAFEILNEGGVTPASLHAAVRLVARFPGIERRSLLALLQPPALTNNQTRSRNVLEAATKSQLVVEQSNRFRLAVDPETIEAVEDFRDHMRAVVLGVISPEADNYLFNLFSAWYATLDDEVFSIQDDSLYVLFNSQLFPGDQRVMNKSKMPGWRNWATFLGLVWPLTVETRTVYVPDARARLAPILGHLLPPDNAQVRFGDVLEQLQQSCPELDHGALFQRAAMASRRQGSRATLSLMLSNALRGLESRHQIELDRRGDAQDVWALFPTAGQRGEVSHIRRGRAA